MTDIADFNGKIIEEFRANAGKVGGPFEGQPMILVHHTGRRSGTERVNPLVCQPQSRGWAVFASKAGAPVAPDWYANLVAHPSTTVEFGGERLAAVAREAHGDEREGIWERQKREYPIFAEYEAKAGRTIPVVVLEPAD